MPPITLKRHYNLVGRNLMPILVKLKQEPTPDVFARPKANKSINGMQLNELGQLYKDTTGESGDVMFGMSGQRPTLENWKKLLHFTIIQANEQGVPSGQELEDDDKIDSEVPPKKKIKSTSSTCTSATKEDTEASVTKIKDKVRSFCLQNNPSEQLILLSLDELVQTCRAQSHEDTDMFMELSKQAHINQGKFNMASFVLRVLGGKASDIFTKALSKSLKFKSKTDDKKDDPKEKSVSQSSSPLSNLYPPGYMHYSPVYPGGYVPPFSSYGTGFMPNFSRSGRGAFPRFSFRQRGNCLFCDSSTHLVRDCEKMKQAKPKKRPPQGLAILALALHMKVIALLMKVISVYFAFFGATI